MKLKVNRKTVLVCTLLAALSAASARSVLHNLDIRVVLRPDGSAMITETRQMTIDDEGTELYISMPDMGESRVRQLEVSDELGLTFENVGEWNSNLSRQQKAGKCGIATLSDGFEICWGLGEAGERTYVTSYELTGLVRSYPDADAIRHVFLQPGGTLAPERVRLTIVRADGEPLTHEGGASAWGFRHLGEISFADGAIVDEVTDLTGDASLYVMVSFEKGLFSPTVSESDTFEHKKQLALEGSDYHDPYSITSIWQTMKDYAWWWAPLILVLIALSFVPLLKERYRRWKIHQRVYKDLLWQHDIPLGGNLMEAYRLLVSLHEAKPRTNNVLLAMVMRLVSIGAFSIVHKENGQERIRVSDTLPDEEHQDKMLRELYIYMRHAAGEDKILSPYELTSYFRQNQGFAMSASTLISVLTNISGTYFNPPCKSKKTNKKKVRREKRQQQAELDRHIEEARQVVGLRKMLREFTLVDERHAREVTLWREYMVWATMFGIADQVVSDMKKINPDYFKMDALAAQMIVPAAVITFVDTIKQGADELYNNRYSYHASSGFSSSNSSYEHTRYEGGGGHTSWGGGGGGFSGSGGRTGIR